MMTGFERYSKKTRRAQFLEEMEQVVAWAKLCALIEPHYPKVRRAPVGVERMLRIYFLQALVKKVVFGRIMPRSRNVIERWR